MTADQIRDLVRTEIGKALRAEQLRNVPAGSGTARDIQASLTFHAHLDQCPQCRLNPFDPCEAGQRQAEGRKTR